MLAALLAFAGVALGALCTAGVAAYRVRTIDKRAATIDETQALWNENRKRGLEIDDLHEKFRECRYENDLMKLRIADLEQKLADG